MYHRYIEIMSWLVCHGKIILIDEKEVRLVCIRAVRQYMKASEISAQQKVDAEELLHSLSQETDPAKITNSLLCDGLAAYIKSLKAIEKFMISDPLFTGFDGSNPLLVALDKEITLTLETKGLLCHEDMPKLHSRIDW